MYRGAIELVQEVQYAHVGKKSAWRLGAHSYSYPTGLTTVTTLDPHEFSEGDKITMAGIVFDCPSTAGITSNIFPAPQVSFTVESVGSAITFETNTGIVKTLPHIFQPSIHKFIRPVGIAITVVGNSNGNASVNDIIRPVSGTNYISTTGVLRVVSEIPHNLAANDTILSISYSN